jgi:hypothetical protein
MVVRLLNQVIHKIIARLIEKSIKRRERALYECALAVENDKVLQQEMSEWDVTLNDGSLR